MTTDSNLFIKSNLLMTFCNIC